MAMTESKPLTPAAAFARRQAEDRRKGGWVRNSFWLSPVSVIVLDRARDRMGLSSREATLNAVLGQLDSDMLLRQEFLPTTE